MPARRLGILVLLVAVLSMHGIQYMLAGAHGPATASADRTLDVAAVTSPVLAPVALPDDVGMTMAPVQAVAAVAAATVSMPGHGLPAHVWSLCLAVLLVGLALSSAILARRTTPAPVRTSVLRDRVTLYRWRSPRPPDLSVLCLLRI